MIEENEVIGLVLSLGVLAFAWWNRAGLRSLPRWGLLFAAFCALLIGRVLTVLEGFVLEEPVNYVEHASYITGALLLAVWCWQRTPREGPNP